MQSSYGFDYQSIINKINFDTSLINTDNDTIIVDSTQGDAFIKTDLKTTSPIQGKGSTANPFSLIAGVSQDILYYNGSNWIVQNIITSIPNLGISTIKIADSAITTVKLDNLAVTNSKIADTTIENTKLASSTNNFIKRYVSTPSAGWIDGLIIADNITDAIISNAKLAAGTTNYTKIYNGSAWVDALIDTNNIANNAVKNAKIGDFEVTESKLGASSVTNTKIGGGAVTNAKIADGTITGVKLVNLTIESTKIADKTLTNAKLSNGTTTGQVKIYNSAAGGSWADAFIDTASIANKSITNAKLADGGTIGYIKIWDGVAWIDGQTINNTYSNNSITNNKIIDFTIEDSKIIDATLTNRTLAAESATKGLVKIYDTIIPAGWKNGQIIAESIADGVIANAKLVDATIENGKIANATIANAKLAAGTTTGQVKLYNGSAWTDSTIGAASITSKAITNALLANAASDYSYKRYTSASGGNWTDVTALATIAGTAAACNLQLSTQANTGIHLATNTVGISTAGTTRVSVTNLAESHTLPTTFNSTLGVIGASTLAGLTCTTLSASGATSLASTLAVTGTSTLTGNTTVGGTLGVTGATTLSSTLAVSSTSTLAGLTCTTLTASGATTLNSILTVNNTAEFNGAIILDGSTTANNNITVASPNYIRGLGGSYSAIVSLTYTSGSSPAVELNPTENTLYLVTLSGNATREIYVFGSTMTTARRIGIMIIGNGTPATSFINVRGGTVAATRSLDDTITQLQKNRLFLPDDTLHMIAISTTSARTIDRRLTPHHITANRNALTSIAAFTTYVLVFDNTIVSNGPLVTSSTNITIKRGGNYRVSINGAVSGGQGYAGVRFRVNASPIIGAQCGKYVSLTNSAALSVIWSLSAGDVVSMTLENGVSVARAIAGGFTWISLDEIL